MLVVFCNTQGWTLALARLPRRVLKVSGECKSSTTRPFGEYDFHCQEIILTANKHCVLHFILLKKSLNINLPNFTKFYIPNCLINWCRKATLSFVNKQVWLHPSDDYMTHVLLQSYAAGHCRAIGDQVNMAPKDCS